MSHSDALYSDRIEKLRKDKLRSSDRIFVLKAMEGGASNSTGMTDSRLFNGENNIHAIRDPMTCLWYLKYDIGGLPPVLKQRWTSFKDLRKFVEGYYKRRNIEIVEVID